MTSTISPQFVILDLETTGLYPYQGDGIIEIAGLKIKGDQIVDQFSSFINPGVPIHPKAQAVHGLSNYFIATNGQRPGEVMPEFLEFCRDSILIGHNIIRFDLTFINCCLEKLNLNKINNPVIDTLFLARRKLRLENYKLQTLANYFKIDYSQAHRALGDAHITREVFHRLVEI